MKVKTLSPILFIIILFFLFCIYTNSSFSQIVINPTITSVSPNSGTTSGGTIVSINGSNFVNGAIVIIGFKNAEIQSFAPTKITVKTPPGSSGFVDVSVTNPNNQTATLKSGFRYVPPPDIYTISPTDGPVTGNTIVTISGKDFGGITYSDGIEQKIISFVNPTVTIGGKSAKVQNATETSITAITPLGAQGPADVIVINPDKQTDILSGGFIYVGPPEITSIIPNEGPTSGGTRITIDGKRFAKDSLLTVFLPPTVKIGSKDAEVSSYTSTRISAVVPKGDPGFVDVSVTSSTYNLTSTLMNGFRYVSPPVIQTISPEFGHIAGGTQVTITGQNFQSGNGFKVEFGGKMAKIDRITTNRITVFTPDNPPGSVAVKITNPDSQWVLKEDGFTYIAPASVNAGPDQIGYEGSPVTLKVTFTDIYESNTHTALIRWGDGSVENGRVVESGLSGSVTATHTYSDNKKYTVEVAIIDQYDIAGYDTMVFDIKNVVPSIYDIENLNIFEGNPVANIKVFFTDPGKLDKHKASISWGDGKTSNVDPAISPIEISHVYPNDDGLYRVTVQVTDNDGGVSPSRSFNVRVVNENPVINIPRTLTAPEGKPEIIFNIDFTDPGNRDTHKATILWGDGSSETINPARSPIIISHTYPKDDGAYRVTVTITDDDGGVGSASSTVTINNEIPVLSRQSNQSVPEGNPTVNINVPFIDPGIFDTHRAVISWGDNRIDNIESITSPVRASHTYPKDDGIYRVEVAVIDDDGGSGKISFDVTVTNENPVVTKPKDQRIPEGNPVVNLVAEFTDPGILDIHRAVISWGDGKTDSIGTSTNYSATSPIKISHTYPKNDGIYKVDITVTDDNGGVGSNTFTVIVFNENPILDAIKDQRAFEGNPKISFNVTFADPGTLDKHKALISWGDGQADTIDPVTSPFKAEHVYPKDDGVYKVVVTITDNNGGFGDTQFTATISNENPVVSPIKDQNASEGNPIINIAVNFTDPGVLDKHRAFIDWGDGKSDIINPAVSPFSISHRYKEDDGNYNASVTVLDDDGGSSGPTTFKVTILNENPVISPISDQRIPESKPSLDYSFYFTDPGPLDRHKAVISWGDGKTDTIDPAKSPMNISHVYPQDNNIYNASITLTDNNGGKDGPKFFKVTVYNEPPVITPGPDLKVGKGRSITISTDFFDPCPLDIHTASISWGDGTPVSQGIVTAKNGAGTVTGSHVYFQNGVYTVTVYVKDDDGGESKGTFRITVMGSIMVDAGKDMVINEGQYFELKASFVDDDINNTHTATVDWGDGLIEKLPVIEAKGSGTVSGKHQYVNNKDYTVIVTVTAINNSEIFGSDSVIVNNSNVLPKINPISDQRLKEGNPVVELNVEFSDPGPYDKHKATINWGDGSIDTIDPAISPLNIGHIYRKDNGIYKVTVSIADDVGIETRSFTVTVDNEIPQIGTLRDQRVLESNPTINLTVTFTDPGTLDKHRATISWGDGKSDSIDPAVSPMNISHTYPKDDGIYKVSITLTDDDNGSASASFTATVANENPVITPLKDQTVLEGNPVVNLSISFTDPGPLDKHKAIISWDDNKIDTINPATSPINISHTYPKDDGIYKPEVLITDDDGGTAYLTFTVKVINESPIVAPLKDQFASESSPEISISISFTDPGILDKHKAVISWGDGKTDTIDPALSPVNIKHVYTTGNYQGIVEVSDDDGSIGTTSFKVTVANENPVIEALKDLAVTEDDPTINIVIHFSDPGVWDGHKATITWGDGKVDVIDPAKSPLNISHTYPKDDSSYIVNVSVNDSYGGKDIKSFKVTVNNVASVINVGIDRTAYEGEVFTLDVSFTDKGLLDTHTATIDWGDGTAVELGNVMEKDGSGTIKGNHIYTKIGNYIVTITVTDDDKASVSGKLGINVVSQVLTLKSITPNSTFAAGGTKVTVTGSNFLPGILVMIGDNYATDVIVISSSQLTAMTQPGEVGMVDIAVINSNGQKAVLKGSFTYIKNPIVRISISPNTASVPKGNIQTFKITGVDIVGASVPIEFSGIQWSVADTKIGRIDSNGIFSPVEIGSTSVQAILKENPSIQTRAEITVPDTEPPKAITATPGSGNQNIPVTSNIQIVFSEDIRFDTIPGGVRIKGANGRDITGKFDLKDKVLSFIPDKPFNDEETITVTATTAIKDMSGNSLASELRFSFSTGIGIWPGDSDNDGNVNILDILPIGQFWNSKGQKRDNPGSNWSIHPAISWQPNKKATYADTNGDGLVDERDIIPIALNWRLSHSLENVALSPANNNMAVYPDADYKAMYQVLESMPIETEGVLALKAILREFILEIENQNKPQKSLLMQNYPNPFNPETWIPYQLKEGSMVKISIFNSFGQLVRNLNLGFKQAGFYMDSAKAAYWDGKNEAGERVSSGCYFYTITTHKPFPIRKMVLKK